jgi:cytoskeletal protein CcmA (bactofilin family)
MPERRPGFQSPGTAAAPAEAAKPSVLGKTLIFKGELSADEDLILQGRVEGSIHHTQSLTVGVDGVVIGDTHARSIVVEGTVEGDLRASVSVLVMATAKVRGNIAAPRVGIHEGANFNGSVDMSGANLAMRAPNTNLNDASVERILAKG